MFNMSIEVKVVSSQGNAGGGGAEDPEAAEVDDLGVEARKAGGAHGAEAYMRNTYSTYLLWS